MDEISKKVINWIGSVPSLIVHTIFFSSIFILGFSGIVDRNSVFAITTNILSIEAIYLAIFIQMTVNKHSEDLEEVSEDIEEIQEDVGEIQEDVEGISEDVEELQEDVEEITEDVGELQEDVEEISEDDEAEEAEEKLEANKFKHIEDTLQSLLKEIHDLKSNKR